MAEDKVRINFSRVASDNKVQISFDYLQQMMLILTQTRGFMERAIESEIYVTRIQEDCDEILNAVGHLKKMVEQDKEDVSAIKDILEQLEKRVKEVLQQCQAVEERVNTAEETTIAFAKIASDAQLEIERQIALFTPMYNEAKELVEQVNTVAPGVLAKAEEVASNTQVVITNTSEVQANREYVERAKADIDAVDERINSAVETCEQAVSSVNEKWQMVDGAAGFVEGRYQEIVQAANFVDQKHRDVTDAANYVGQKATEVKETAENIQTLLDAKQDKLVAGDNVTIVGNTISASGGAKIYVGTDMPDGFDIYIEPEGNPEGAWVDCTMSFEWSGQAYSREEGKTVTGSVKYKVNGDNVEVVAENFCLKAGTSLSPRDTDYSAPIVVETLPLPNGTAEGVVSYETLYGSGVEPYVHVNTNGQLMFGFYNIGYGAIVAPFNATFTYTKG